MAPNRYEVFSIALVMVMLSGGAMVTTGCTIAIMSLSPCISYVTGNVSTPSQPCCAQLSNVAQSEPLCFCALFSSGHTWTSSKVNKTLAKGLPKACNVTMTALSGCSGKAWLERWIPPSQSALNKESVLTESSLDGALLRGHVMPMAPSPMPGIVERLLENKTNTVSVPREELAATTETSDGPTINYRLYFSFVLILVASICMVDC